MPFINGNLRKIFISFLLGGVLGSASEKMMMNLSRGEADNDRGVKVISATSPDSTHVDVRLKDGLLVKGSFYVSYNPAIKLDPEYKMSVNDAVTAYLRLYASRCSFQDLFLDEGGRNILERSLQNRNLIRLDIQSHGEATRKLEDNVRREVMNLEIDDNAIEGVKNIRDIIQKVYISRLEASLQPNEVQDMLSATKAPVPRGSALTPNLK